ncbi:hypothetical protein SASPL_117765 [Salvia splendens]|uniref:Uncharacterized protein n=1 Tax=Salvia splendens TaxID=180675 RepID=A0A8X8XVH3_SALSN|nr:hypothetical protein SASPL_117765 [Salvia splendens]
MSKKIKGVILEDGRATLKYRTLMQDYHHLQKEVDIMSSRLEAGKQKKVVLAAEVRKHHRKMLDGGIDSRKVTSPFFDLNTKGRISENDTAVSSNVFTAFDLKQDGSYSRREPPLPSRALIFDLNEISVGSDEDFQTDNDAVKYEETRRSLMRHPNDEVQNELKLSMCRNAGEGPSRVGKRKISWQDPVALRV